MFKSLFSRSSSSNPPSTTKTAARAEKIRDEKAIEEAFIKMRGVEITEEFIDRARAAAGPFWDGNESDRQAA